MEPKSNKKPSAAEIALNYAANARAKDIISDKESIIKSNSIFDTPNDNNVIKKRKKGNKRINFSVSKDNYEWLEEEEHISTVPIGTQCSKIVSDYIKERRKQSN
jgi:hypothetical protein